MIRFSSSVRLILIVLFAFLFATGLWYTYSKQQERFTFNSFHVNNEKAYFFVPHIDRLKYKIQSSSDLSLNELPATLISAINTVCSERKFDFEPFVGKSCMISYNENGFLVAFRVSESYSAEDLAVLISDGFNSSASGSNQKLLFETCEFEVHNFNHFLVVSNQPFEKNHHLSEDDYGNSDFILFQNGSKFGEHHIINEQNHYVLYDSITTSGPIGEPVSHANFLRFIPATFTELSFTGSKDFQIDQSQYFGESNFELFNWVDEGMFLLKKDSFELLIAPQNTEVDLKMILQEETELYQNDSTGLFHFNIGPYAILSFKTEKNWQQALPELNENFHYFTEIENYNVLANSIPAIRWYLGEVQLGNLFVNNPAALSHYMNALPAKSHKFSIKQNSTNQYTFENRIWKNETEVIVSKLMQTQSSNVSSEALLMRKYNLTFIPDQIITRQVNDEIQLIVSSKNHVTILDTACNILFDMNLISPLMSEIQIADFENDGSEELILFQQNQLNVLNAQANSVIGWPLKFNENSSGGIVVNYDESYNHRLLTSVGNQIKSIDEQGKYVDGWMFTNMSTSLKGKISYYVAQGKDMISFKDLNNMQYVINRRGESRVSKPTTVNLPNESGFVVGNLDETSLRKLGYRNNYIINYYLFDGQRDSVKLDRSVNAIKSFWIFNNNQPLLVLEEIDRAVVIDEFGYEKKSVLKPSNSNTFAGLIIEDDFAFVFVDNSQNTLYLLNEYGKMVFPNPVKGSNVYHLRENLLFTSSGQTLNIYKINKP